MTNDGWDEFALKHFGDQPEKLKVSDKMIDQHNAGTLSYEDVASKMANLAEVDRAEVDAYMQGHQPNSRLVDFIRDNLRGKYKIGLLSNSGADWFYQIFSANEQALFDDVVLSYKVGFIKPQPQIFELALKNLGVTAQQAVFIDDIAGYCNGARGVGMQAIHYRDFNQMKAELEVILVSNANN